MDITKTAKEKVDVLKDLASDGLEKITPNEKLAAAAAIGVVVGGVAGAVGHALIKGSTTATPAKARKKPAAI